MAGVDGDIVEVGFTFSLLTAEKPLPNYIKLILVSKNKEEEVKEVL